MREFIEPTTSIEWLAEPGTWMGGDLSPELALAIAHSLGAGVTIATLDGTQIILHDEHGPLNPFADRTVCNLTKDPEVGMRWFPLAVAEAPTPKSLRAMMDEDGYARYRLRLAVDCALVDRHIPRPARQRRGIHGWRSCPAGEEPFWVTQVRKARTKRLDLHTDGRAQLHLVWPDGKSFFPMIDGIELRVLRTWFDDRLEPKPQAVALSPSHIPRRVYEPGDVDDGGALVLLGRLITGTFGLRGKSAMIMLKVAIPLPTSSWDQFLGAALLANSMADARAFVDDVAEWLGVEVPEPRGIGVEVTFNWHVRKLTLNGDDGSSTEVYLNLHSGGSADEVFASLGWPRPITLNEKDSAYRDDLVRLLMETLANNCE